MQSIPFSLCAKKLCHMYMLEILVSSLWLNSVDPWSTYQEVIPIYAYNEQ